MLKLRSILIFVLATCPVAGQASLSDLTCDDSARMTHTLQEVMGAERQGLGLRDPDTMLEVWVKSRTGDFVVVQSYANGTSCIVAMGEHWQSALPNPA